MSLAFNEDGLLPVGDHAMTLDDLARSVLVIGQSGSSEPWDEGWRLHLVGNLGILTRQLWHVGIQAIYINGSFVEDKAHPNDIDGYFECDAQHLLSGRLQKELNLLDPDRVWTWDAHRRTPDLNSTKLQLPMWHRYRVELYPEFGQLSGIVDEFGNTQLFPAAFRKTRGAFKPKGIIRLVQ